MRTLSLTPSAKSSAKTVKTAAAPVRYRVAVADLHGHRFAVTLRIAHPAAQQRLSLPVWIPGSYLVREFSKHLLAVSARRGGQPVAVTQLDKCTWEIDCKQTDSTGTQALEVSYEVYAFDNSVRTAWLDAKRGFFNSTSLCLAVEGQTDGPQELTLVASRAMGTWSVATGLAPVKVNPQGFGSYRAADYDELVDCPVEMGPFWQGEFKAHGVPHRFVVAGAPPSFDGKRLLADTQKICEAEISFWHGASDRGGKPKAPHKRYVFMLNAVDDGYGGLEHRNSTALICTRRDLPRLPSLPGVPAQSDGYTTLLGLISHEYFHTWNVKRLRPTEFTHFRYNQENYTQLLWFFEGFTSYYDDVLLRRAGLIDDATYVKLLAKTINQVVQTPGRRVQSVAESSFDAWVKYYRVDENTPNVTVSYYTKGALVALCFDLSLRAAGCNLDDVMRQLWRRCKAGPMTEADFAEVMAEVSGRRFDDEIRAWVHGTGELPLKDLLQGQGVVVLEEPVALAQQLGLRVSEGAVITLKTVLRGGLAEQAGFAAGDEWLGIDDWRISKLDDVPLYAGKATTVKALISRDKRLLRLPLALPGAVNSAGTGADSKAASSNASTAWGSRSSWRLVVQDPARVSAWLAP